MKCPFCTHVHFKYKIENATFYIQKLLQFSRTCQDFQDCTDGQNFLVYNKERKKKKWKNYNDFLIEKTSDNCYSLHKITKNMKYRAVSFLSKRFYWFEYLYFTIKSRKQFYVVKFPFHFSFIFEIIFNQIERRGTWISSNFRNGK